MTATLNESATAPAQGATGRIARVIGPVVDVEFPAGQVPDIYNALTADLTLNGTTRKITFETAQHLGDSLVRAISLQQTDGLVRGQAVVDTGAPISVPVGDGVKGHIFNVLGDALDVPNDEIKADTYWPIHRAAPGFADLEGSTEMLETGIKSIDLLTPYIKGGKIDFRVDRNSNLHFIIGKASFTAEQLTENFEAALEEVNRLKPSSAKGRYISKATIATTFGPGVPVDPSTVA